jgi:hypothetical protein
MNGDVENGNKENAVDEDELELVDSSEETIVLSEDAADIDTVGDFTGEIAVEKLVAKIESGAVDAEENEKEVHRRIEDLNEQRKIDSELDSTFNFNMDEDL